jgi:hypothetical protein
VAREPRQATMRYQWPCPGDLLHRDVKRFQRFGTPGPAETGNRQRTGTEKRARVGYGFAHTLPDDHRRYAYTELHPDERAATATGFVQRGLAPFAALGVTARRLLTDNPFHFCPSPRSARAARRARHPPPARGPADPRPTARSDASTKRANPSAGSI